MTEPARTDSHDTFAALRQRDYRFFLTGNVLASLGLQMQKMTIGWEIVNRAAADFPRLSAHDQAAKAAEAIAWVGIVQVLPAILLAIPAGHVIDRFDRKRVIMAAAALIVVSSLGLAAASLWRLDLRESFIRTWSGSSEPSRDALWRFDLSVMYFFLLLNGVARAFVQPAKAAFLPQIVPLGAFSNAVTWNTGGFHLASIVGPQAAGELLARTGSPATIYALDAGFVGLLFCLLFLVKGRPYASRQEPVTIASLTAGLSFVYRTKLILGALTLDMFAVLLGGATALLPIFAKDLLHVGPRGLGLLQSAQPAGALVIAFLLARLPPMKRAGPALLWSVAGFGVATIVFGISQWFALSLAMLFVAGACDNVSVVVRHTLMQLLTPDHMRGRVSAVNSMFIGASNELGAAESGFVAGHFGAVFSVVSGGIGTLLVVAAVSLAWPQVRRYGRLGSNAET